jgi:hypothetical protein
MNLRFFWISWVGVASRLFRLISTMRLSPLEHGEIFVLTDGKLILKVGWEKPGGDHHGGIIHIVGLAAFLSKTLIGH